ncbi:MAG: cell division ATP-binding protein FtsE [Candidatus Nealsonbacteria bacterium CG_4_9_14_0_2_um_filter_37_38]|uniref:Cell division ATP-binding protein FtsE n=1 Tax=Candidatus Nealsonbacteria bacterium CG_4_10_14_0_8_um_filter_37_14 TaxID=1974684 RepID=A0A2M7R7J2_9BACT|nr:MAG: cell division ATP-binding protein FtsE [Candidatus Nealsonbacteria bacterium CG11_big_fil_rev_8_21_14_0_20_37_68]PIW91804.1 MAG: cell division ATP-binding protein FtsE [Candidatus Nealsonbacteria bacterium CG_4_8_14_3_um_filter_37_23]PIY89471.1 MAG: cell division ATP-binding protein FtsE [Candidatus Nealsonbacteria bacterium CG_4_10_14_0_8_um_filter_37_14]PJC51501.1 MAG: cell division ATP-binding protein FtsE [Candidatus Nealsonbacteria bacterium CG_4_9_14_0_2_um_filter_37_38]
MIKFQNITKVYPQNIIAINNVSFDIKEKEFVCIVGRSGAGKTTLLKLLLAIEQPTRGKIFFEGKDISKINSRNLPKFRRKIGAIFQDYKLLPSKTVYENIAYVMELMGRSDREIARETLQILEIVELENRSHNFPNQLSGGEQQRAAIARAIAHRPQLILADEPTGNLDPYHTQDIIRLLKKIHKLGTTVILATHHGEIIDSLKERVVTLEQGEIIRDEEKGRFII